MSRRNQADINLRREFKLPDTTSLILPDPDGKRVLVSLGSLNETQARAVLTAARDAGVKVEGRRRP